MQFYYSKNKGLSLNKALTIEWLETNGLGGYASSSAINCHTRKYHGLLVSKVSSLSDKYVLLSKLEDVFFQEKTEHFLTAHLYPNCLQNGSFANLEEFQVTTHPVWNFKFSDALLTKEILMPYGENTVLFKYTFSNSGKCQISLRPLLACRNFHNLQHENSYLATEVEDILNGFGIMPYQELPKIFFQASTPFRLLLQPLWYHNFIYDKEKERGYDYTEDLFSPGIATFELPKDGEIIFACSTLRQKNDLSVKWQHEVSRRKVVEVVANNNELQGQLQRIGQSFITTSTADSRLKTIVAGYHWFLEWGRDAMISLPGLTLYSGQEEVCLSMLKTFALHESHGLIPNFFGVTKESNAYNTVDASLWFVWAIQQYYLRTQKLKEVVTYFWVTLKSIFTHYRDGTKYNIKMLSNGLISAGSKDVNLTWMDAVINNLPVTPRYGCQVEINALWFNMLSFMEEIANKIQDPLARELHQLLSLVEGSFRETFWCEKKGYLYDFVNSEEKNSLLRPNQILAVSLPYSPLLVQMAVSIVAKVKEHLLTPYGLRTLASHELGYIGHYQGSQSERDKAYHNGTVWPWLLGHFVEALLKVTSDRNKALAIINPCLDALQKHLAEHGVGSVAEIFSGDYPHEPDGCISQAWSVAEVLRLTYLLGTNK